MGSSATTFHEFCMLYKHRAPMLLLVLSGRLHAAARRLSLFGYVPRQIVYSSRLFKSQSRLHVKERDLSCSSRRSRNVCLSAWTATLSNPTPPSSDSSPGVSQLPGIPRMTANGLFPPPDSKIGTGIFDAILVTTITSNPRTQESFTPLPTLFPSDAHLCHLCRY
jgi:hypothetical protein